MNPHLGYPAMGAVHYPAAHGSRSALTIGVLASLGLHLGILFGLTPAAPPQVNRTAKTRLVEIEFHNQRILEEPEPLPVADDTAPSDPGIVVPTLVDTPTFAKPHEFVQPVDLSTLIQRPETDGPLMVIPAKIARTPTQSGVPVFNLRDLDRTPVAVSQPPPTYPHAYRREALTATVMVGFIVDTAGRVVGAYVVDSTHPGFNDAAIAGVSKWKFRAGFRGGHTVNTRMLVPIVFRLTDER